MALAIALAMPCCNAVRSELGDEELFAGCSVLQLMMTLLLSRKTATRQHMVCVAASPWLSLGVVVEFDVEGMMMLSTMLLVVVVVEEVVLVVEVDDHGDDVHAVNVESVVRAPMKSFMAGPASARFEQACLLSSPRRKRRAEKACGPNTVLTIIITVIILRNPRPP
eukprot:2095385-Amphidinium_carterae.1